MSKFRNVYRVRDSVTYYVEGCPIVKFGVKQPFAYCQECDYSGVYTGTKIECGYPNGDEDE